MVCPSCKGLNSGGISNGGRFNIGHVNSRRGLWKEPSPTRSRKRWKVSICGLKRGKRGFKSSCRDMAEKHHFLVHSDFCKDRSHVRSSHVLSVASQSNDFDSPLSMDHIHEFDLISEVNVPIDVLEWRKSRVSSLMMEHFWTLFPNQFAFNVRILRSNQRASAKKNK